MPHFQFQVTERGDQRSHECLQLGSTTEARLQAIRLAGRLLDERPERLDGQDMRVEVSTEHGLLLFTVIVLSIDAAAARAA